MVCIYNVILINHKKKIMPFGAIWMNLKIIILSEASYAEKEKYCMISLICRI